MPGLRYRILTVAVLGVGTAWGAPDAVHGRRLFAANCAPCHGPRGDGGKAADLTAPRLRSAPDDEALFRVIRFGLPGTEMPLTRHFTDSDIADVIAYIHSFRVTAPPAARGDPVHGEQIYRTKGNCAQCHTVHGSGGAIGPDLTDIGARRSAAYLRESLVNPEASVPESFMVYRLFSLIPDNFLQVRVATRDGRSITGVRVNEDPFSIQLRDFSGKLHSFWKEELVELHKERGKSPMPGYHGVLGESELEDLVAYLVSLRGEP